MKPKIPWWINLLQAVILAILVFQTYACYFQPSLLLSGLDPTGAVRGVTLTLGGRNSVMAILSIAALVLQAPRFYQYVFAMHFLRELQDMILVPIQMGTSAESLLASAVFLFVFVIPEGLAFWKLKSLGDLDVQDRRTDR